MEHERERATLTRRTLVQAAGYGAAMAVAAACAAPGGQPGGKAAAPARISVVTRGGGDGQGMEQVIIPAFTKTYPTIQVDNVSLGGEPDYWVKVVTGHLGKELGDVVWASNGGFSALGYRGVFTELEPLAKADKYDFKDYVPAGLDSLKINGKLEGLPWGGHPGYAGLLYNEDLLASAGQKPPDATWTWDKLLEVCKIVSKVSGDATTDVYGFNPNTDYLGLIPIVRGNGGDILDAEGRKMALSTPSALGSLNFYRDLYVKHRVAAPVGSDLTSLFVQGRLAMWQQSYGGQFSPGEKGIAGRFKWGMVIVPKGSTGKVGTQLTVNGMTIWSGSKNPDAAWKFLKFIMEPEIQLPAILSGASRPGLRKSVLRHPRLMTEMKSHAVWVDLIETASPWHQPWNFRWAEVDDLIKKGFVPAWKGEQTIEQTLGQLLPQFDAILAKPREGFV
jgi:ABC-type glycerol-3-phosphate transport system substrate-binding protein